MLWRGPMGGGAASGKIGAMIASHCAQGQYLKHRVKCVNPRTELQHPLRNALRSLASMWGTTLDSTQRASWATYAANVTWVNRLGDTVHLSGQMEFCRSNWPRFQIGLPLVLDAPVIFDRGSTGGGTITISVGNDFGVFAIQAAPPWQDGSTLTACMVYMGLPRSAARTFMAPRTQLSAVLLGTFGALTAFPPLQPRGNVAQYNQAYPSWLVATYSDGRLTTPTPLTPVFTGPPPGPTWTELFTYPDGPLAGNGGWTDIAGPDTPWSVLTDQAHVQPNTTAGAIVTPSPAPPNYTLPWTATAIFTVTPGATDVAALGFNFGDLATTWIACNLNWDPGSDGPNILNSFGASNTGGGPALSTGTLALTSGVPHTLTLTWSGVNLTAKIDGVTIASGPVDTTAATSDFLLTATSNDATTAFDVDEITIQAL